MTQRATLDDLTESQQHALSALLDGATVTEAAKAAGVRRQSVSNWRNRNPVFIAALNAAARDQLRHVHDSFRALAPAALAILAGELEAGGATASRAARDVLRMLEHIGPDTIGSTSPSVVRHELEDEEEAAFFAALLKVWPAPQGEADRTEIMRDSSGR